MGKANGAAVRELVAFHEAVLRRQGETGRVGQPIPMKEWDALLTRALSTKGVLLTPQSCKDKTWALEALGLVQWDRRVSIIVLPGDNPQWQPAPPPPPASKLTPPTAVS